jgi:hypothetical protein
MVISFYLAAFSTISVLITVQRYGFYIDSGMPGITFSGAKPESATVAVHCV